MKIQSERNYKLEPGLPSHYKAVFINTEDRSYII